MADDHSVTLVVITRNRREDLAGSLEHVEALPERPPVIVVDNGSTDGTAASVRSSHPSFTVVALQRNAGAAARTVGAALSSTPFVAFSDDDSWWAPGALSLAVRVLEANPRLALTTGRVLVGEQESEDATCRLMARSPLPRDGAEGVPVLGFLAGASVMRRQAFLSVGGYHPRFTLGGEEELLAIDLVTAGWRLAYLPDLVAHHHPSPLRDVRERRRLLVRNRLWTIWLRRPGKTVWRRTIEELASVPVATAAPACTAALRGLPWVLRQRRAVPAEVEELLRAVERDR